jgi:hypothetical protein
MTGAKGSFAVLERSPDKLAVAWVDPVEERLLGKFSGAKTHLRLERSIDANESTRIHCSHDHGFISGLLYARHVITPTSLNREIMPLFSLVIGTHPFISGD